MRPDFNDRVDEEDKATDQLDNVDIGERLTLKLPMAPTVEAVDPGLDSARSTGSVGGFEKNVSPFEIAKMFHPHWKDCGVAECADISHLAYNFGESFNSRLSVTQKAPKSFFG